MQNVREMLDAHPSPSRLDAAALAECIADCLDCGFHCTACADACLASENPKKMARCIRTDLDCADVCQATQRLLSRQTETDFRLLRSQVQALATACAVCAEECEQHADMMRHCKLCGESCRRCEKSCHRLLASIPG